MVLEVTRAKNQLIYHLARSNLRHCRRKTMLHTPKRKHRRLRLLCASHVCTRDASECARSSSQSRHGKVSVRHVRPLRRFLPCGIRLQRPSICCKTMLPIYSPMVLTLVMVLHANASRLYRITHFKRNCISCARCVCVCVCCSRACHRRRMEWGTGGFSGAHALTGHVYFRWDRERREMRRVRSAQFRTHRRRAGARTVRDLLVCAACACAVPAIPKLVHEF